ncbi:hypothetical protein QNH46_01380 [Paenibacillus woosongensis]|uniref:Uncharacterized protein n=1 Tax=Paenibacillus woosongensis TaxID=307580 RepID=A0AA95I7E8_9BACL|nr:hypothetical protein [Paenibacillus woosongensis]WHX49372.1 hypothetical protein QNH46_01380 [Paenibacillus woosongensis]
MQNKWRTYGGITLILILIAYIIYLQFNYQVHKQQEAQERQEMEQLLRSKEKQVEFYFKKANELISSNQKLEMKIDSFNGGETMELDDQLVSEVLDSREYQEIMAKYEERYGILDKVFIPENETLGGLRYKVKESIAAGYDLLPKYYGITNALMWMDTKEFKELNNVFKEHFGDVIPTEEIYGTFEELNDIIHKSVKEGKNLLPEYYGYGRNG